MLTRSSVWLSATLIYLALLMGGTNALHTRTNGSLVRATIEHPVAGPDANPLPRMNCPTAGTIRNDDGVCVDVEAYFSTGENTLYWISQKAGRDRNAGTRSSPWRTIRRSTVQGVLRPGDVVIIREGVYRESISPQEAGEPGRRLTFAAYPGERVVISGADLANDGWTPAGSAWRRPWTVPLPAVPNQGTLDQRPEFRREMVIVDDSVLIPVYMFEDLVPGTFFVEGADTAPVAVFVRLPGDAAPSGHVIELGRRGALFLPKGATESWCGAHFGWYRLVGLTFRHAVNNANWAAVCSGYEGSLLEENTVEWTNGTGIDLQGYNNVVRGNRANDNGMRGLGGRCTGCSIEYNETSRNNWKGHSHGYSAAGVKLIRSANTTVDYHLSADNDGTGIWLDVSNRANTIENSLVIRNASRGILLEFGTTETVVRNNVVYGTRYHGSEGSGIQSQAASDNFIVHNSIIANEGHGIWIRLDDRDEDGHNRVFNNLLIGNAASGRRYQVQMRIDGESLAHARTNVLDGNVYGPLAAPRKIFALTTTGTAVFWGDDVAEWTSLVGSDHRSTTLDPGASHVVDLSSADGWRLVRGSMAAGRGVPLPNSVEATTDILGAERPRERADVGAHQLRSLRGAGGS